jgi:prophage antirepressor-like protein
MKYFLWQFQDLNIPMMLDDNRTLYTTTPILASALGVDEGTLRQIYQRHQDEFDGNCVTDSDAISFLSENRKTYGLTYVRGDMHLWSEDDMILFAGLSRTPVGKAFRKEMVKAIKAQARKGLVTEEYFDSVVSQLLARVSVVEAAQPALDRAASAAGTMLQAQKHTKGFRS